MHRTWSLASLVASELAMAGTASSSQPGGGSVRNRSEMIKAEIEERLGRFAKGCA